MNDLLAKVLEAHGGLHRWKHFNKIQVKMVSRGKLFELPDDPLDPSRDASPSRNSPLEMTIDLHKQHALIQPFGASNGYAMWTSLTAPFFLSMPGISVMEIEPWRENDLLWRGLSVAFPPDLVSNSSIQDFYFGSDYLLRRHDCTMHAAGALDTVQYVFDRVEVNGIQLPMKRRIFRRGADGRPVWDELLGAVDLSDLRFF